MVFAMTGTAYHSFIDMDELLKPPPGPEPSQSLSRPSSRGSGHDDGTHESVTAVKMQRQDSGYASYATSPRASLSLSEPRPLPPTRRISNAAAAVSASPRPRTRPPARRWAKSYPQPQPEAYFQFPVPDLCELSELSEAPSHQEPPPQPPQPTHYWTGDSTRRLEYAAIDAASRGVKGWVRRHLVPECFSPKHIAFDDDTGSVRRYRLHLEDQDAEPDGSGSGHRRKGWNLWRPLRKSRTH